MNSSFTYISILVKSNLPKNCLVSFLNDASSQSLRSYLRLPNVYDGNANKKKSFLIKMIVCGCMNYKLKNSTIDQMSINKSRSILKEKNISTKSLPGYGNLGLKKREIKPYDENKECSIKLNE